MGLGASGQHRLEWLTAPRARPLCGSGRHGQKSWGMGDFEVAHSRDYCSNSGMLNIQTSLKINGNHLIVDQEVPRSSRGGGTIPPSLLYLQTDARLGGCMARFAVRPTGNRADRPETGFHPASICPRGLILWGLVCWLGASHGAVYALGTGRQPVVII